MGSENRRPPTPYHKGLMEHLTKVHHFRMCRKCYHDGVITAEIFQHPTCLTSTQMSINQTIIQCRELCDERIVQDSILFKAISNVLIGDVELIKKLYQDLECLVKLTL